MINAKDMEIKDKASKDSGFSAFMANPMTKAIIASIPPCDNLEILLKAAFDSGHASGQSLILIEMLTSMGRGPR